MANSCFVPTGNLRDDLARLMGQEQASSPAIPDADRLLGEDATGWRFRRLTGLSRFWTGTEAPASRSEASEGDDASPRARDELTQGIEDLLTSVHALGQPLAYLVLDGAPEVELHWGMPTSGEDLIGPMLAANLPGARLQAAAEDPGLPRRFRTQRGAPHRAFVTGVPTPKRDQVERLLRGLGGSQTSGQGRWAFLVLARPLGMGRVVATLETLAHEIRRTKHTHLRKDSAEAENHPLAQYYVELLQAALGKYQAAQLQGAWEVRAAFLAADEATLQRGAGLLTAAFAGASSRPRPLRVEPAPPAPHEAGADPLFPATVLNTPDLGVLIRPPREEVPGLAITTPARFAVALPEQADTDTQASHLAIGQIANRGGRRSTGQWLEIPTGDLAKHAFVTGVTGSGKTETCLFLLDQLWREQGVPFWVIEPAKREYRALQRAAGHDELTLLAPGADEGELFRLNPFDVPRGTHVQTHIDLLRSLINASFAGLYAPMPYLLEQALYEIYQDRDWDLTTGERPAPDSPLAVPTLTDLAEKVEEVVWRAGYASEITQNVATALQVRLNSLRVGVKGRMLDTRQSLSIETLLGRPTVLELAALGDEETIAFLMGLLWMRLYEHRLAHGPQPLQHVTLIEEAHRLLAGSTSSNQPEAAQTQEKAVEAFSTMLLELRAFGEGLLIADQSPAKIHPDVLKGTNLKIAHRLVAEDDRDRLGGCANMDEAQRRALATLTVGQAAAYAEGVERPFRIRMPPYRRYALSTEGAA